MIKSTHHSTRFLWESFNLPNRVVVQFLTTVGLQNAHVTSYSGCTKSSHIFIVHGYTPLFNPAKFVAPLFKWISMWKVQV